MGEPVTLTAFGLIVSVLVVGIGWALVEARRAATTAKDTLVTAMREIAEVEAKADSAKADLAKHKVYVAENYASVAYMRDVEARLTAHLVRIETKLDERTGTGD